MKKLLLILFFAFCLLPFHLRTQWVQQTVPVNKPITGIKFIDANTGWACANIGTGGANYSYILHTINGGTNWLIQDSSFGASLLALSVVNSNIAYCGGFDGASTANLYKTTNGGMNWLVIATPTNMSILDMQFLNKDSGWTVGGSVGADVRTTTNGGLNWIVRTSGIASQTQRIFFLNYNTGFCGANNNVLYKTTDAGLNWISNGTFSQPVQSIFFLDISTGWVGTNLNRIFHTTNSGINWVQQTVPPNGTSTIFDIYFNNSTTGYAGTSFDKIFKTVDGGLNWGYQVDTGASYRITMLNDLTGWTGSLGAKISKTTNGGGPVTYLGINTISTEIPGKFTLYQNYPNPFNPVTKIKFDIKTRGFIKLAVYDMLGRIVNELVNEVLNAGTYEYTFEDENLPSGTYFYRLIKNNYTETRKMILIK